MNETPTEGVVRFYVELRIDPREMRDWSADRIKAFFDGLSQAIAARELGILSPAEPKESPER